eukprot:1029436-Prorocentrum_minimum.AAC.3
MSDLDIVSWSPSKRTPCVSASRRGRTQTEAKFNILRREHCKPSLMLQDIRYRDGRLPMIVSCELGPKFADGICVVEEAAGGGNNHKPTGKIVGFNQF